MNTKLNPPLWSPKTWEKKPPSIVISLALQVNMEPMEWKEYEDRVVIVFTCGKKIVFYRDNLTPEQHQYIQSPLFTMPVVVPLPPQRSGVGTPAKKKEMPAIKSHAGKKTATLPAKSLTPAKKK